ncbi:hypothetical protein Aeh1ORF111c [Aeromonas phage Aeh1]|uniref:Uncharacterized protein n=1 Tax=Aeromonas phage Aeh1 TaxID=2880362 RepID=Q76YX3_9CAUD|nr:endonuclease [Aeromonas phage Aeh1]AAQ17773.1 hypothetical protein Aeh1ORF111c [Aeromonas phage Aeh1]
MIGFACQMGEVINGEFKQFKDTKFGTVRVCDMDKLNEIAAKKKLADKVNDNLQALENLVLRVAKLPQNRRMLRVTSDLLPLFTHPKYGKLYEDLNKRITYKLALIGDVAQRYGIRLSMHPSQYTVVNSDKPEVVDAALIDLEMHTFILKHLLVPMGEGIINIHLNGKTDIIPVERMSDHLKSYLTFENDEKTGTLTRTLEVCEKYGFPLVFDIHHHRCNKTDGGILLRGTDPLAHRILGTWIGRKCRAKMHVSQSRGTDNFRDLCAHSDMITEYAIEEVLSTYIRSWDIMVEAKFKNVAAAKLAGQIYW